MFQFNADMCCVDQEGRSALWYAQQGGSRPCADLLVHSGLDKDFGVPPANPPLPLMPLPAANNVINNNNHNLSNTSTATRMLNGSASSCGTSSSSNVNNNNNHSNNGNTDDSRQSLVKLQASVI